MKKIKHLPLNWPNGLKLTGQHFVDTHLHWDERLQHIRSEQTTTYNYGLDAPISPYSKSVEFDIEGASIENTVVSLKYCSATTHSGRSILFQRELYGSYTPTFSLSQLGSETTAQGVYIVVSVNPEKMIPVGYPDPNITPLHHPNVLPEVQIYAVPIEISNEHYLNSDYVIIAKGKTDGRYFVVDTNYIPPVRRTAYSEVLCASLEATISRLNSIDECIGRIFRNNADDNRRSPLTTSVFALCQSIQGFCNHHLFELENLLLESPPIFYLQSIGILARTIHGTLRSMSTKEYEYLLQYFYEWTDISPSTFESRISNVLSLKYNHLDIAQADATIRTLVNTIELILRKMSELEYIGLIRENIIISDDTRIEEDKSKSSWHIID